MCGAAGPGRTDRSDAGWVCSIHFSAAANREIANKKVCTVCRFSHWESVDTQSTGHYSGEQTHSAM